MLFRSSEQCTGVIAPPNEAPFEKPSEYGLPVDGASSKVPLDTSSEKRSIDRSTPVNREPPPEVPSLSYEGEQNPRAVASANNKTTPANAVETVFFSGEGAAGFDGRRVRRPAEGYACACGRAADAAARRGGALARARVES